MISVQDFKNKGIEEIALFHLFLHGGIGGAKLGGGPILRSAITPLLPKASFSFPPEFSEKARGISSGGLGRRLVLEFDLPVIDRDPAALTRDNVDLPRGVLMWSAPPASSLLYFMFVYSRPTNWDFCSAASL